LFACGWLKKQKISPAARSESKFVRLQRTQKEKKFACGGLTREKFSPATVTEIHIFACGRLKRQGFSPAARSESKNLRL